MAEFAPYIGLNNMVSFVDAAAAALTRVAGATLAGSGRKGTNSFAAAVVATPQSVANDRTLVLTLKNPNVYEASPGVLDLTRMLPLARIWAATPVILGDVTLSVTVGNPTLVAGVYQTAVTFLLPAASTVGARTYYVQVDFGYSSSN